MTPKARIIRRAVRYMAQSEMEKLTVTDSGKNEDGSWWVLIRDESRGGAFAPYYRIDLTITED